jgi:hypothetical protein
MTEVHALSDYGMMRDENYNSKYASYKKMISDLIDLFSCALV